MLEIETVDLTEILDRTENGMSRPFICRCSDDNIYYVKSNETIGYAALCSEAIAACIASDWGLPIPPYRFIRIDPDLLRYSGRADAMELKTSPAWGVQAVQNVTIYSENQRQYIDNVLCGKILLFDRFIRNEDRQTGNTNLLWNFTTKQLTLIDHNNAFEKSFDIQSFCKTHIFRGDWDKLQEKQFEKLIRESILKIDDYFSILPEEWQDDIFIEDYRKRVTEYLLHPQDEPEKFWSLK